jgi:hypothetical protein
MLRKIHGTNFFHIKLLDRINIKCKNGPVLPRFFILMVRLYTERPTAMPHGGKVLLIL